MTFAAISANGLALQGWREYAERRLHERRDQFLHITLDLTYQGTGSAIAATGAGDGLDEIALAPEYRLKTTRSARSTELHYFDHPAFGVLVRVTPVPTQDGSGRRPAA